MAYNCPGGCTRIGHFSNAEIAYNGVPTGYAGAAENADAIDATATTIASFRQSGTPTVPTAPSGLNAYGISATQVDLTWVDTSTSETGFLLERSLDGVSFTQIASLPANTTSYRDGSLAASTLYYYRARAWNGSGNSPYNGVATASTQAMPQFLDQLVSSDSARFGVISGTLQNTYANDGTNQSIKEVNSAGTKSQRYGHLEHYWAIQVKPGTSITLYADVSTISTKQGFTFAYSTFYGDLTTNKSAWIDMFTVSATTSGMKQFTLPPTPSGWFFISVRDNQRIPGVRTSDSVNIDYLAIRTMSPTGSP
jgi:hypothetical protein